MFLYSYLIILPTAVLAVCNDNTALVFFDAVDANNDTVIDWTEVTATVKLIDINKDQTMTKRELKKRLPLLSPDLTGKQNAILNFLDIDEDGEVSPCDNEVDFKLIDKNKDGVKSREEFQNYVNKFCSCACP